jgi:phosphatidylglycerophosphate synthase
MSKLQAPTHVGYPIIVAGWWGLPFGLFAGRGPSTLPAIARAADSEYSMAKSRRSFQALQTDEDMTSGPAFCPSAVLFGSRGGSLKVAGLSVMDRLVICLFRAGIGRIVIVGNLSEDLPRSTAMGVQVERVETPPALSGQVLVTPGNVLVGVGDLRKVIQGSGRLIGRDGQRLPVGIVEGIDGSADDWGARLDQAPEIIAEGPVGCVTDGESARSLERAYWASLTSSADGLVDRWFNRPVGRWLSLVLVDTPVTPNQVSVAAILVGLASAGLFAFGTWGTAVWGALVLQLSAIMDCVDGDLARAQCRESAMGKWLDLVGDQVVHLGVFLGLGVGLWRSGSGATVVVLGITAAVGVILSFLMIVRVLLRPELRGHGRVQRLIDATTNRDFSVLLIVFALGGVLPWFMWMAAVGSHLFWILALGLQIQEREPGSSDEQAA